MADRVKPADRDQTLINILERMADQLLRQDSMLNEVIKQQGDSAKEASEAEFFRSTQFGETEASQNRIQEALKQYRATMLSLVNEQDNINDKLKDVIRLADRTAYALENFKQQLSDLDERIKKQETTVNDHFAHSLKQTDALPKEIAGMNREVALLHAGTEKSLGRMHEETQRQLGNIKSDVTRLHAGTEKHLGQMHEETQRQLDKLKQETSRRLMALDGMEVALQTLLIRTEPPEKKPLLIARLAMKVFVFFRKKVPLAIRRIRIRRRSKRDE